MNSLTNFAMAMLQKNPQISNSPMGQEFLQILQSGDSARGEQLANNLCQSYGTSRDDAIAQAKQFFHL